MPVTALQHIATTPTVLDDVEKESASGDIAREPPVLRIYMNRLTPPIGTSFFHKETITIFDNARISGTTRLQETLTWRTDVYKYATGARPDEPNFKEKGGEIYIIMVHAGTGQAQNPTILYEFVRRVKAPSSIIPVKQYPASHSGIQSGDNWAYNINYLNMMPMFNNGGNAVFQFDASFQEDFIRYRSEQTGFETNHGVEFAVLPRSLLPPMPSNYSIIGLSVFKCLSPSAFPAKFNFEALAGHTVASSHHGSISKDVSISFNFTRKV